MSLRAGRVGVAPDQVDAFGNIIAAGGGGGGGGKKIIFGTDAPSNDIGKNGQIYVRRFPLPEDVTFLASLATSGSPYIDTGLKANQGTDFYVKAGYRGNYVIMGTRGDSNYKPCLIARGISGGMGGFKGSANSSASDWCLTGFSSGSTAEIRTFTKLGSGTYDNPHTVNVMIKDATGTRWVNNTFADFQSAGNILLFAMTSGTSVAKDFATIYRATIYQNSVPVADFLPAIDSSGGSNVYAMWESIGKQFYYNAGTGTFSAGAEATPAALEPIMYVKVNDSWVYAGTYLE